MVEVRVGSVVVGSEPFDRRIDQRTGEVKGQILDKGVLSFTTTLRGRTLEEDEV